jgi:hypothetical protein
MTKRASSATCPVQRYLPRPTEAVIGRPNRHMRQPESAMRAEAKKHADDIKESISLLRRYL